MGFASKKTLRLQMAAREEYIKLLEERLKESGDSLVGHDFVPAPIVCVSCGYGRMTDFHYPERSKHSG